MPKESFPKTSWTVVLNARDDTPEGRKALAVLCDAYWFPVYAFLRRRGASAEQASDQTQGFFAHLIEKNALASLDRARGTKFRSWLLGCVKHHLQDEYAHARSAAAGGNVHFESLDAERAEGRYQAEPSHDLTPERLYDRAFAENLLHRVLERVREKYAAAGKSALFDALKGTLTASASRDRYEELAARLGRSEGDVRKAAFDLRGVYKKMLLAEVESLVDPPPDAALAKRAVDDEIGYLLRAFAG
ncbi:sigma factor [Polyangium sp. 6x1]|uniref:RNA polymerase sigma factor n=1 Tax=Polyangium sp. 6x1 TaxID=3042689 RepID=UPI00248251A3|nr:sigma factor [Polyangium sp. 6x1]MDI1449659.1 sigma factor [Polyangium sp. 6x1]